MEMPVTISVMDGFDAGRLEYADRETDPNIQFIGGDENSYNFV